MLKVVFDSNIFISAIFWSGNPNKVVAVAADGKIKSLTSLTVMEEIRTSLARDFSVPEEKVNEIVANIISYSELIKPTTKIKTIKADPSDNKFLEIALEAKADYIVSGDKHLLGLKEFRGIKIVTAKEMMHILEGI